MLRTIRHPRLLVTAAAAAVGFGCGEPPAPAADPGPPAAVRDTTSAGPKSQFVGTWELVRVERIAADGTELPPPDPPAFGSAGAVGYIMYDPVGYMGVVIMQAGRQPYAGETPTPDEALAALRSYVSYFGTYSVNAEEGYVTHHLQGNVSPAGAFNDNQRFYEFSGDQLVLMPPPGQSGVQLRIVWQRVPELPAAELTETHRRLFGFYRLARIERWTLDDEPVEVEQADNGFIIYMPSGHMAVHIMRPNRPTYTGTPTPEQALRAVETYASYFGPFSVHEDEGYFVHHRIGNLNPGESGTDAQRFFELTDTTLTLMPPPRVIDGRELTSKITWERLN